MTPDQIREMEVDCDYEPRRGEYLNRILREGVAQLAELNEHIWAARIVWRNESDSLITKIRAALDKMGKGFFG